MQTSKLYSSKTGNKSNTFFVKVVKKPENRDIGKQNKIFSWTKDDTRVAINEKYDIIFFWIAIVNKKSCPPKTFSKEIVPPQIHAEKNRAPPKSPPPPSPA